MSWTNPWLLRGLLDFPRLSISPHELSTESCLVLIKTQHSIQSTGWSPGMLERHPQPQVFIMSKYLPREWRTPTKPMCRTFSCLNSSHPARGRRGAHTRTRSFLGGAYMYQDIPRRQIVNSMRPRANELLLAPAFPNINLHIVFGFITKISAGGLTQTAMSPCSDLQHLVRSFLFLSN